MDDVHNNINGYSVTRKRKTLLFFDDMILWIKKIQALIKELFIGSRKLNISLVIKYLCSKRS